MNNYEIIFRTESMICSLGAITITAIHSRQTKLPCAHYFGLKKQYCCTGRTQLSRISYQRLFRGGQPFPTVTD